MVDDSVDPRPRRPPGAGDPLHVSGAMLLSPNVGLSLPGATFQATCIAKDRTASDPLLLVAQYPTEDPMQLDLYRNGFQWYCFTAVGGRLFVAATRDKEQTVDAGWSVSPRSTRRRQSKLAL
jgi:hypothetical protein